MVESQLMALVLLLLLLLLFLLVGADCLPMFVALVMQKTHERTEHNRTTRRTWVHTEWAMVKRRARARTWLKLQDERTCLLRAAAQWVLFKSSCRTADRTLAVTRARMLAPAGTVRHHGRQDHHEHEHEHAGTLPLPPLLDDCGSTPAT